MSMISNLIYTVKHNLYTGYQRRKLKACITSINSTQRKDYASLINGSSLSPDEINAINKRWGFLAGNEEICHDDWRIYKTINQFNADYVSFSLYHAYIVPLLNHAKYTHALADKTLLPYIFNGLAQPETILRCVAGIFFDSADNIVPHEKAKEILEGQREMFLIKPANDTYGGNGITIIDPNSEGGVNNDLINNILHTRTSFIIQRKLTQSPFMSALNESSLNTMRITTVLLPDKITPVSAQLKIGKSGAFVDNAAHGSIFVGINQDGTLRQHGVHRDLIPSDEQNGIKFGGMTIPNFDKVLDFAKEAHLHIAPCQIVGWDIALDENNQPVLIEDNIDCPGITYEQATSGPFFGSYTDEIIDYLKFKSVNN